jgi:hypothetical protein
MRAEENSGAEEGRVSNEMIPTEVWAKLSEAQRADILAHVQGLTSDAETYPAPRGGWTCFHCGENFRTAQGAALHFGQKVTGRPICVEVS